MEILVALIVLMLFAGIVWQIASSWMRDSTVGIWREKTSKTLQRATSILRQHVERASYPAGSTPEAITVAALEGHFVVIAPDGGGDAYTGGAPGDGEDWSAMADGKAKSFGPGAGDNVADSVLLEFVQGKPGYHRVAGIPEAPVRATRVRVLLEGKKPVYHAGAPVPFHWVQTLVVETTEASAVNTADFRDSTQMSFGGAPKRTRLVEDVNRVICWAENVPAGKSAPDAPVPVGIKIFCVEPGRGRATVWGRIVAQPKTGVSVR